MVKTPLMMLEYMNAPQKTADSFDGQWFRTGDIGFIKDDYLFIQGRTNVSIQPDAIKVALGLHWSNPILHGIILSM